MKLLAPFFLLLFIVPMTASAATVQAYVDRNRTRMDTPIQLTVSLPGRGGTVDTGAIQDFDVHTQGTSTQVQIINGRQSEEQRHTYLLVPKSVGRLTVPALKVTLGGKVFNTQPITVTVTKEDAQNTTDGQAVTVQATVSETAPYIGQQFVYSFVLRYGIQMANTQYTPPAFDGFTAKQIGDQQSRQRIVSGRRYQEVVLSYVLLPIRTGTLSIAPAVLRCDTVAEETGKDSRRNRFGNDPFFPDSFFRTRRLVPRIFKTDAVTIDVRALPRETGGLPFSGLVGEFTMDAVLEKSELAVGDSLTLSVTIQGNGNIMDAESPEIRVTDAFKQYSDTPESDIQLDAAGYHGKKVFRMALVAVAPGTHSVVPAPMTYFDPRAGAYRQLGVSPLPIVVRESDTPQTAPVVFSPQAGSDLPGVKKKKVGFTGRDILPLKIDLDAVENVGYLSYGAFFVALFVPVLFFLIGIAALRCRQKNGGPATVMTQKSQAAMKQASRAVDSTGEEFFSNLYRALVYAVCATADTCSESVTYEEALKKLHDAGIVSAHAQQVSELMKKIDRARYGGVPLDVAAKKTLLMETSQLMKGIHR